MLETSNFVHGSAVRSLSLVKSECSLSGRGQGHVNNFYIVDLENVATASRRYRWYTQLDRRRFVYDTYKTMKATGTRHGWVHMFIPHRPTLTLQLHNFDLLRTCRTSSSCTVAWQLAIFQLTRRIARSLGDSWASCYAKPVSFALKLIQFMPKIPYPTTYVALVNYLVTKEKSILYSITSIVIILTDDGQSNLT